MGMQNDLASAMQNYLASSPLEGTLDALVHPPLYPYHQTCPPPNIDISCKLDLAIHFLLCQ